MNQYNLYREIMLGSSVSTMNQYVSRNIARLISKMNQYNLYWEILLGLINTLNQCNLYWEILRGSVSTINQYKLYWEIILGFFNALNQYLYRKIAVCTPTPFIKGDWHFQKSQEGGGSKILGKKGVVSKKGDHFEKGESIPKSWFS